MKRYIGFIAVAVLFSVAGCGNGGHSAPPPTNVVVVAKDSRIVVTWDAVPGVEYWLYKAEGDGVTPENCISMPSCTTGLGVSSPSTVTGLTNGTTYSVSINGRIDGGAGGAGSVAVSATPRMAGTSWTAGAALTTSDLRAVTYGAVDTKFVAVGAGGALYSAPYSSSGSMVWTVQTNPLPSTDLNAVNYDSYRTKYVGVGAGGAVISKTGTSTTWVTETSNTTNDLNAVASNTTGLTVAAGAAGTIVTSSDGSTWTERTSNTVNALNGVAYGSNLFVAVGAGGTLLYSTDGTTWSAGTCASCGVTDLKGVVYGATGTNTGVFIAVGTGGAVLTSPDGATWTPRTSISSVSAVTLNAVAYTASRRFVAVGDGGKVYYSELATPGTVWTQAVSSTATNLYGIATDATYDYSAVGVGGLNIYSD